MQTVRLVAVLVAILPLCLTVRKCPNLPKVPHDARETVEPYDNTWMLTKSYIFNPCVNYQYIGNKDGNSSLAIKLFISRKGKWTVPAQVVVNSDMTEWEATQARGIFTVYSALFFNKVKQCWCDYSCKGDNIDVFLCYARNQAGKDEIEKQLNTTFADLPWMENSKLWDSFPDSCNDLHKKPVDYYANPSCNDTQ